MPGVQQARRNGHERVRSVVEELRAAMVRGDYVPNQRLVESDLCEQLGASRATVGSALRALATDGLVEIQPIKGAGAVGVARRGDRDHRGAGRAGGVGGGQGGGAGHPGPRPRAAGHRAGDAPGAIPGRPYRESARLEPPDGHRPALKNQAAPFPGRGADVRRLDHVSHLAADVAGCSEFLDRCLGAPPPSRSAWTAGRWRASGTRSDKSYDLVVTVDRAGARGRLHHVALTTDTREDILRAADVCLEHGIHIETGPHKHAIQQTFFLCVYEPGGNRVELCKAGARLVQAPDWELVTWTEAARARGQAWGLQTIESFHTHGTPPVD